MPIKDISFNTMSPGDGFSSHECQMVVGVMIPTKVIKTLLQDYRTFQEFITEYVFRRVWKEFEEFLHTHNIADYHLRVIGWRFEIIHDQIEFEFEFRFIPRAITKPAEVRF